MILGPNALLARRKRKRAPRNIARIPWLLSVIGTNDAWGTLEGPAFHLMPDVRAERPADGPALDIVSQAAKPCR